MLQELLKKYYDIYLEAGKLEAQRVAMRDTIVKLMVDEGKGKIPTDLGTFTVAYRKHWLYSKPLEKKLEDVKIAQLREQDKGVATSNDTPYLLFTPKE